MTHPLTPREKVARCIVGPRNPVPDNSKFTLNQLRQVKWSAASESEKSDALWAADAILTALASGSGDHAELARLAEAATPGPWSAADWDDDFGENRFTVQATEPEKLSPGQSSIWPDGIRCLRVAETMEGERPAEDAAFIAAANPATVLALIAENAALRGEVETLTTAGIVEVAVRNPSVSDYVQHWEGRATEAERKLAEAVGLNDRAAELMRQCTDPERFEGVSTLNVYANMRAWLSDLPPAPGAEA